jgi:hypothetical protein
MARFPRRLIRLGVALLGLLALSFPVNATWCCPFCANSGPSFTGVSGELNQARMVLYGSLVTRMATNEGDNPREVTDLHIDAVIKDHPILAGRKVLPLPKSFPGAPVGKYKFLIFFDIFKKDQKEQLDAYRGVQVNGNSDVAKYLKGALEVKDEKPGKRLRYFFEYLDDPEIEISTDAYKEFANADYKDYRDMAKHLPPDRIADWLKPRDKDKKTPTTRFGLYASMLGHCGKEVHAVLLRQMLDDPENRENSGIDGMLAGYVLLKPQEGWQYVKGIMKDPKKEFLTRYAALRAARFFWDVHTDLISHKNLTEGIDPLLEQTDVADFAIEDFRKWKCWDMTDRILGLRDKPVFRMKFVRRQVLRFAISASKSNEAAAKYVAEQRKSDPKAVEDAEELLKLETPAPTTPGGSPAGKLAPGRGPR